MLSHVKSIGEGVAATEGVGVGEGAAVGVGVGVGDGLTIRPLFQIFFLPDLMQV